MVLKFVVCFAIVAASLANVEALQKEEMAAIYEKILPHVSECSKAHGLGEGDLKEAKEGGRIEGIDSCFFACVLKKTELLNDAGLFDTEKTLQKSKEFLKEEDDIKKAAEVIEECSSVNSADVSDGAAGCDRAKLLVTCMAKHKQAFWGA